MINQRKLCSLAFAVFLCAGAFAESLYFGMEEFVARARALTKESIVEIRAAAELGKSDAQVLLGFAYLEGTGGLVANSGEAAKQFESAAVRGQVYGQLMIATLYFEGRGVEQDAATATRWLERAGSQGNPEALYMLGNVSLFGAPGVEKNIVEAHKWFTIAIASTTNVDKRRAFEASAKLAEKELKPEELDSSRKLASQWLSEREPNKAMEPTR